MTGWGVAVIACAAFIAGITVGILLLAFFGRDARRSHD